MDLREASHSELDFNAPLSDRRAAELVDAVLPLPHSTVLDLGCGWAELLLRILEAEPSARGIGVDADPVAIARATANAERRGLRERLCLHITDAATWTGQPVDAAISIGASHAWGEASDALAAVHASVRPGGRVLFGDGFWEREPTTAALAGLDAEIADFRSPAELVALVERHGYRLLRRTVATRDEWDDFESRWCAGVQRWLLANPAVPEHAEARAVVDEHRTGYLDGYRGVLGFAYLVLARL